MDDTEKSRDKLLQDNRELRERVQIAEQRRILTHEDALKLAIIDRAPFTMWACDRDFKIVLWAGQCEQVYGYRAHQAKGKNYLKLFVDEPERPDSQADCIAIIDDDVVFRNFIAEDVAKDGSKRYMLTNCFRIWDDEKKDWLQAEVAIEISDIHLAIQNHRTLREAGIAMVAMQKRILEVEQKELASRVRYSLEEKSDELRRKEEEWINWFNRAGLPDDKINELRAVARSTRVAMRKSGDDLISRIHTTKSIEDLQSLETEVTEFERRPVPEFKVDIIGI